MKEMPRFNPRNVAKFVVKTTIQIKTAAFTRAAIANHTSYEKTDTSVQVAGGVVGWYVAEKAEPYTDQAVDKTADFVAEQRAKHKASKPKPAPKPKA